LKKGINLMNTYCHPVRSKLGMKFLVAVGVCSAQIFSGVAFGQSDPVSPPTDLAPYSQDFDSIATGNDSNPDLGSTLYDADPWRVFGNASDSSGNFLFGYGPFFAPNNPDGDGSAFSNVATGEPTTSGDNYLNVFNDYNNGLHSDGSGGVVSSLIFQERNVLPENVGEIWTFEFDYRSGVAPFGIADGVADGSTAGAFVTVLQSSDNSFFTIDRFTFDTTSATTEFQTGSIEIEIIEAHVGERLQFGFECAASNFGATGVFYDTVSFAMASDSVVGDFDGDGDVDCDDLDSYVGNLGSSASGVEQLDLNGDNSITIDDANLHITTLIATTNGVVGTFPGDLNCDGTVNVLGDAFALVANLGSNVSSYSEGDINFDGTVNVLGDAFVLVGNLGMSN
jgi:hypothetical protein